MAIAGADDQVLVAFEHQGNRKRTPQPLQRVVGGVFRPGAAVDLARDEMRDDLGVGLRGELVLPAMSFVAQFGEVLDDAVMDDGDAVGKMRMGIGLVRHAVRRPAGVVDADGAVEWLGMEAPLQIAELALGAPPRQMAGSPIVAMPAESYPRYSSRLKASSSTRGATGSRPTIPTIPHIFDTPSARTVRLRLRPLLRKGLKSQAVSDRFASAATNRRNIARLAAAKPVTGPLPLPPSPPRNGRATAWRGRPVDLARTPDRQRILANVCRHYAAGGDIGVLADGDGSDERRIRSDESALADDRAVFAVFSS